LNEEKPVGVSLLAIAVYQVHIHRLTHRYREQAHSYRGTAPDFLSRHADSCQDYVTAPALFKPTNRRKCALADKP